MESSELINTYSRELRADFHRLLRKAKQRMPLFYMINLFQTWYPSGPGQKRRLRISDFEETAINWKRMFIDRRQRRGEPLQFHEMLFLFQLFMEAKSYYARLRNFIRITAGNAVHPEPWSDNEWARNSKSLKTRSILDNLRRELEEAQFSRLSKRFAEVHLDVGWKIRNAIAHGTFEIPKDNNSGDWVFANYELSDDRRPILVPFRLTHEEFVSLYQKILAFRSELDAVVRHFRDREKLQTSHYCPPDEWSDRGFIMFIFAKGQMTVMKEGTDSFEPWK